MVDVVIYGDSIMKGATPEGGSRYRSVLPRFLPTLMEKYGLAVTNRARFGCTIDKGYAMLQKDLSAQIAPYHFALVEYGGNDCDYDWKAVAAAPDANHQPHTSIAEFLRTLEHMADELIQKGVKPLLMTLPPIDAERYLSFICRDGTNRENIVKWLGETQMIYRFQEMYSASILKLALHRGFPLVDVRPYFLDKHNYADLISIDGIHPSEEGYALIHTAFDEYLRLEMA
ncbi:MAG: SGNH/GDSL hydrolase family protein [Candidatus Pelethousia sp.]|nr:SGNH/GDSL hydrolase family protein [Candidatus Pelethousia sp.]